MSDISYKDPFYLQLREVIRSKIEEGEYAGGCAIPSESQLAERYGVNRLTVRTAVDALVSEGMLRRIQGKGVYVVATPIARDLDLLQGFRQTMREHNAVPSVRILVQATRPAGSKYAAILRVNPEDNILYVRRLNSANGSPIALEESFISLSRAPQFDEVDLSVFDLYSAMALHGIVPVRAWETLDLVSVPASDARMLGIAPKDRVLLFTSTSYDANGVPVEHTRSYTRGDTCCYDITIGNK